MNGTTEPGRTCVVTGAGSGIGLATAAVLVAAGERVHGLGRSPEKLAAARARLGPWFSARSVDVRDRAALEAAFAETGPIDVLVMSAGICRQAAVDDHDSDAVWADTIATNLTAVHDCMRFACPTMAPDGRIVAVASGLAKLGRARHGAYAAAKHGVLGLVRSVARELAHRGITVNAVCPGWVDTDMARADLEASAARAGQVPRAARREACARIPLGRFVAPEEVAALILWLCSPEAAAITGQAYNISGGEFCA